MAPAEASWRRRSSASSTSRVSLSARSRRSMAATSASPSTPRAISSLTAAARMPKRLSSQPISDRRARHVAVGLDLAHRAVAVLLDQPKELVADLRQLLAPGGHRLEVVLVLGALQVVLWPVEEHDEPGVLLDLSRPPEVREVRPA